MDKQTGQTPFTDEELAQALRLGTDTAARRQGALRSGVLARVQAPMRRRPLLQTLAACAAAVVLLIAAVWALTNRLPQWDVVQPLATNAPQIPPITLTTNIQRYTPALNSVQGITITARDSLGNPLSGDWKASWGVFLGPVSEQGNLIPGSGDYGDTLRGTARAMWSFAPDAGEIPVNIKITFTAADGQAATLLLTRAPEKEGFVVVVASVNRLTLITNTDHYTYGTESPYGSRPMLISAVDAQGNPIDGDWKASFGSFGQNDAGYITTMQNTSSVTWDFVALIGQGAPETAEITFTAGDGSTQTLHLKRFPQDAMTLWVRSDDIQPINLAVLEPDAVLRCSAGGCANQYKRNSISSLKIEAVDEDAGMAVAGFWRASFGKFIGYDGAMASTVRWSFSAENSASIPQTVEITFYPQSGRNKTLHLDRDADNPDLMKVRSDELILIPQTPSTSAPVEPTATSATSFPSAEQTLVEYFQAWHNKDESTLHSLVVDKMTNCDYELEKLKDITLLEYTDETQRMKHAYSNSWYTNPAEIAVFLIRFQSQTVDPNSLSCGLTTGIHHMDYYLVRETADGPWKIATFTSDKTVAPTPAASSTPDLTASPSPAATPTPLPEWTMDVHNEGQNMALAKDAQPKKYLATPTQWQDQITVSGTLRLPKGWSVSGSKDDLKLQDKTGQEMGTLVYNWLDALMGEEAYINVIDNHTELISFQKLQGYSCPAYRLLLEADNGSAASGITGVTVQSETVFIPGTTQQRDGKTYYEVYILRLYKARTGDGDTKYLLNNQTIDAIAQSWQPPTTSGLTAQQTVEAYFEAWKQKDLAAMDSHVLDSRKGTDYEFDKLKSIQLLDCTNETQQMKGAFSTDWYNNPVDIAVFRARFRYTCKDPNSVCSGMTSGTHEMDYYLVKETANGPWIIVMWGNG